MITIFNREEVYNGFSLEKFSRIRDILQANHIKYNYKCVSQTSLLFNQSEQVIINQRA